MTVFIRFGMCCNDKHGGIAWWNNVVHRFQHSYSRHAERERIKYDGIVGAPNEHTERLYCAV